MEGGEDPHLAILTYASTPLNHSLPSPAELLNSRKYRCILPVRVRQQNHIHRYRNIIQQQNDNKHSTTTEMQEIYPVSRLDNQSIYSWSPKLEIGHRDM